MISNHYSASLSELDMAIVRSIPEGGNWKDVPASIVCRRIETIRASYERGEGSRSTYYGRLRSDAPSYTINTYFSRPGNGCHVHYAQDRVISHREAARFQSFPDAFEFRGSKAAVGNQIGNAVPPLMAYQVALQQGEPGCFVDLFAGAGGLSLGFRWAGWKPLVANDFDKYSLDTYSANIHDSVVLGDIRDDAVREEVIQKAREARRLTPDLPLLILGGPPCQGFSTAGKKRSMEDERNHLFREYRSVVDALDPDGFVFENVLGLLSMKKGKVFQQVCDVLGEPMADIRADVLKSDQFGVPQRRSRVFVVARREGQSPEPPSPVTAFPALEAAKRGVGVTPGAEAAIGDLPAIGPSEDGCQMALADPSSNFQRLSRGLIAPDEYLDVLKSQISVATEKQLSLIG
ncbi:MAG: DNA (cytosine-5-)-methyltransferase [Solirubrobacterales bacterium]|nr:DNA (cytosine-5-)-methyltransferase [Solirubrobacterales bacterium]